MNRNSFATFIGGPTNRKTLETLRGLARRPSGKTVVLGADVGQGKSHLLAALATALRARGLRTCLTSCEEFVDDLVDLVTRGAALDVLFDCDALLIDDVDDYAQYAASRKEFVSLLAQHLPDGTLCVLTAGPSNAASLARSLASAFPRLDRGSRKTLRLRIGNPDRRTVARIVRSKARELGIRAPTPLLAKVSGRRVRHIREVESCLLASVAERQATLASWEPSR